VTVVPFQIDANKGKSDFTNWVKAFGLRPDNLKKSQLIDAEGAAWLVCAFGTV